VGDIDTAVVDGLKVLDPNGRLEKLPRCVDGTAGVQVNGATAAAMIDTTLLDSNASGATAVINGGHMLTYGNNRIVGTPGSGFTGTASPQ
jgi:hypothetical protein